jgi:hypothetical protein
MGMGAWSLWWRWWWHRAQHRAGTHRCRLLQVQHAPECEGCLLEGQDQCAWVVEVECIVCGAHEWLP